MSNLSTLRTPERVAFIIILYFLCKSAITSCWSSTATVLSKTWSSTYLGNIAATSLSVFCLSTSSSSVLSLIRSSRLDEYCSNMRSMESIMFVFFPLVMLLNCSVIEKKQSCCAVELSESCKSSGYCDPLVWRSPRTSASSLAPRSRPVSPPGSHPAGPRPRTEWVGTEGEALWPY